MKEYLFNLIKYNHWANKRICDFIFAAGEDVCLVHQVSSFPTIRETVFHIWDAEGIWLNRLKGDSLNFWPSKNFSGSTIEGCKLMVQGSYQLIQMVELIDQNELSKIIDYKNIKGVPFQITIQEIISHLVNHSTFHRGQLITMLRVAEFTDLKSTDLIGYFRENNR